MTLDQAQTAINHLEIDYAAAIKINKALQLPVTLPGHDVLYLPLFQIAEGEVTPLPMSKMERHAVTAVTMINGAFVRFLEGQVTQKAATKTYTHLIEIYQKLQGAIASWQHQFRYPHGQKVAFHGFAFTRISEVTARNFIHLLQEALISIEQMQAGYEELEEEYHEQEWRTELRYRARDIMKEAMPT